MGNNPVIEQIVVLFLIMIVGMVAARLGIIDGQVRKKLSQLLVYVTSPFLVILSFNFHFSQGMLKNAGIVLLFSLGVHSITAFLGKYLFIRYPKDKQRIFKFMIVFSNCAFMGFPVLESLFGKVGVFYASIYNVMFQIFLWTYGIILFSSGERSASMKKAFFNPGIISVAIGMVIFLFSMDIPSPIVKTLDMVGGMTAPLSMLIIGALLANIDLRDIFVGMDAYYNAFLRLLAIPLISILILKLIGIDKEILKMCVLLVAMPAAANTVIFSEMYGADSLLASRNVALSTILSLITIPLIMMLV